MKRVFTPIVIILLSAVLTESCSTRGLVPIAPRGGQLAGGSPFVRQSGGSSPNWVIFPIQTPSTADLDIVVGKDKNLWFTEPNTNNIARIDMTGTITEMPLPFSGPGVMAIGADGRFYVATAANKIARVTTTGSVKILSTPSGEPISAITRGPDGKIWLTESGHVASVTTKGVITEYVIPTPNSNPTAIATGPDGNLWFTESLAQQVAKISPSSGQITEYLLSTQGVNCTPAGAVAGPDSNVWVTCSDGQVLKIEPNGTVLADIFTGRPAGSSDHDIITGPDKALWFTSPSSHALIRVALNGTFGTHKVPQSSSGPENLVLGPDGNIWVTDPIANSIDVSVYRVLTVSPSSVVFTRLSQSQTLTVSETHYGGGWTATSSNPSVATVAPGGATGTFTVTPVGAGSCTIVVADKKGNSFSVSIQVNTNETLYVANWASNTVTAYPANANGDAVPVATIAGSNTGLNEPTGVLADHAGNLYVTNQGNPNTVTVYPPGSNGNVTPSATISCANMNFTFSGTIDSQSNLYVSNDGNSTISVVALPANGCVNAARVISGQDTGLDGPLGTTVDASDDLYVPNQFAHSITEYSAGASGDAAPIATLIGNNTLLSAPSGVTIDNGGDLDVIDYAADSFSRFSLPIAGNQSPSSSIVGSNTGIATPYGMVISPATGLIFISNRGADSITVFAAGASGNASPVQVISGADTGLSQPEGIALVQN